MVAYVPFFESYPVDFRKVITYLLATVIFHSRWIAETLPEEHPIFRSLFWREGAQQTLRTFVLDPCPMQCQETGKLVQKFIYYNLKLFRLFLYLFYS